LSTCLRNICINTQHKEDSIFTINNNNNNNNNESGVSPVAVIIIIIIIITISFMQGIYTYIPETNNVPKEYKVAAIL
jgi:hypothetical protein